MAADLADVYYFDDVFSVLRRSLRGGNTLPGSMKSSCSDCGPQKTLGESSRQRPWAGSRQRARWIALAPICGDLPSYRCDGPVSREAAVRFYRLRFQTPPDRYSHCQLKEPSRRFELGCVKMKCNGVNVDMVDTTAALVDGAIQCRDQDLFGTAAFIIHCFCLLIDSPPHEVTPDIKLAQSSPVTPHY